MRSRIVVPVLVVLSSLLFACGPSQKELDQRRADVAAELSTTLSSDAGVHAESRAWRAMQEFYGGPEAETVWVDVEVGPRERVDELIALLGGSAEERAEAREDGEQPLDTYGTRRLAELRDRAATAVEDETDDLGTRLADLELAASYAFLTRAFHTLEGRVDPTKLDVLWFTEGRKARPLELLVRVRDGGEPGEVLDDLEPAYEAYDRLLEARDRYRALVEDGGWPTVPADGPALEDGARGPRVTALARRLAAEGDFQTTVEDGQAVTYDASLAEAVRRFQVRFGLEPDGVVGGKTLEEMNVPAEARLEEIELNLERWRWMPGELGDHYLVVNIPEYRLRAVRDGDTELEMRVIVGKRLNQTPVFSDTMTYIVLNPEWNIPESIASSEVVPKILAEPGYAESQGIEVVTASGERVPARTVLGRQTTYRTADAEGEGDGDMGDGEEAGDDDRGGFFSRLFGGDDEDDGNGDGDRGDRAGDGVTTTETTETVTTLPPGHRLRQAPGRQNPLGQVKFMFPNEHNIYLHDTPTDNLFASTDRGFSHGCIRLERPLELADYVLAGDGSWTSERIRQVVASGERTEVALPEDLAVHLTYFTAWVDADGRVQFREDLYGHDDRLAAALDAEEPLSFDPTALRGAGPETPAAPQASE